LVPVDGFAIALIVMGAVRELIGRGTLFAGMELLFPGTHGWQLSVSSNNQGLLLASLPPGAFIIAGLLLGSANALFRRPIPDANHRPRAGTIN